MLRCRNANALRTSVDCTMAIRVSPGIMWARVPRAPLCTTTPFSSPARRVIAARQVGPWRSIIGVKRYSTQGSEVDPSPEETIASTETQMSPEADTPTKPRSKGDDDDDALMRIAMAGTSPRVREQEEGRKISKKVVEMELKWLQDPRELADRVARLLKGGDVVLAAALVRAAQNQHMECSVAWNHILEHSMKKRYPKAAFKFYNEMKKRGRKPNARTYTIMLNGLSKARKDSGLHPLRTAMSIYRSISASNSDVKPNIIHSNAMLNVCCRQGDMDALWEIAGELPEDGPGSPDPMTYTIIFRAIQDAASRDVARMQPHETERILARKVQSVKEGKRIWSDIVFRWKNGQLSLDNQLVSAMANVLLESASDHDCYDVFKLISQTTGIPVLAKEPLSERYTQRKSLGTRWPAKHSRENREVEDVPFVDEGDRLYRPSEVEADEVKEEQTRLPEEEEEEEETFENLFDAAVSADSASVTTKETGKDGVSSPTYIPIGNRELTMILEACLTMVQGTGVGKAYWQHLTQEDHGYKIQPDAGSLHQYLRLLRVGRSSRATVEVLRDQMAVVEGKTFHIAMSCCRRDRRNLNVLKHANDLLGIMDKALILPDPRALQGYLEIVHDLEENPHLLVALNGLGMEKTRPSASLGALGRKLQLSLQTVAVENLRPHIAKLNEALERGRLSQISGKGRTDKEAISGPLALKVMARTRGLIDAILKPENASLLTKTDRQRFEQESQELRKYSKAEMGSKFNTALVHPTPAQVLAFREMEGTNEDLEVD